jgi:hypothetical protein
MWEQCIGLEDGICLTFLRGEGEDILVVESNASRVWIIESSDNPQQCGFATTRRTQQREEFSPLDLYAYIIKSLEITIGTGYPLSSYFNTFQSFPFPPLVSGIEFPKEVFWSLHDGNANIEYLPPHCQAFIR